MQALVDVSVGSKSLVNIRFDGLEEEFRSALGAEYAEVDLAPYFRELEGNVKKSINGYLGRIISYVANDVLFEQDVFADSENANYNLIVDEVQGRIGRSLQDFVSVHVNDEAQKILRKIKLEN